jgi:hypothetical protein
MIFLLARVDVISAGAYGRHDCTDVEAGFSRSNSMLREIVR